MAIDIKLQSQPSDPSDLSGQSTTTWNPGSCHPTRRRYTRDVAWRRWLGASHFFLPRFTGGNHEKSIEIMGFRWIWGVPILTQPHVFDLLQVAFSICSFESWDCPMRIRRRLVTYHQAGRKVATIWPRFCIFLYWLVVWNMAFIFHILGIIIPMTNIFRGVGIPPTSICGWCLPNFPIKSANTLTTAPFLAETIGVQKAVLPGARCHLGLLWRSGRQSTIDVSIWGMPQLASLLGKGW